MRKQTGSRFLRQSILADDGSILDDVTSLSADFEQSLVDANGVLLESSSGRLVVRRPGQFRWSYKTPYEQELVADGLNIWSYDVMNVVVPIDMQHTMAIERTSFSIFKSYHQIADLG